MTDLEDQVQRRLKRQVGAVEKEITSAYAQARRDIREEIAKVYEKYAVSGELTRAEMAKYNRLTNLEDRLTKRIGKADTAAIRKVERLQLEAYREAFLNRAWQLDMNLGARLSWGRFSDDAVRAAVENPLEKIAARRLRANSRERIRATIASGLTRGDSFPAMAEALGESINGTRYDALRIARTEGNRAQALGTQKAYEEAEELGVEGREYWIASIDSRTRDSHANLDGKPKQEEGWYIQRSAVWTTGPMQSGVAKEDVNCRCSVEFRVNDEAPKVRRIKGEVQGYQTFDDWKAKNKG